MFWQLIIAGWIEIHPGNFQKFSITASEYGYLGDKSVTFHHPSKDICEKEKKVVNETLSASDKYHSFKTACLPLAFPNLPDPNKAITIDKDKEDITG